MTAADFLSRILVPDLAWLHGLLPSIPASKSEVALMCAIPGQESAWQDVRQGDNGIAVGLYQQQANDIADIFGNVTTSAKAVIIATTLMIEPNAAAVYSALLGNTKLQVGFARLNLLADWRPFPAVTDQAGMFKYYLGTWRPGKPSLERWNVVFPATLAAMKTEGSIT